MRALLVLVHPWAEEMNKCRHVAADIARTLAEDGCATLLVDLLGCGDSSGDYGDASWSDWVNDVVNAAQWGREQHGKVPLWLGGMRAGALVAASAARHMTCATNFLFVQPVLHGRQHLQQFLRVADGARWVGMGNGSGAGDLRATLAAGKPVEVGGYQLSPALTDGLASSVLAAPATDKPGQVRWIEVTAREPAALAPASQQAIDRWSAAGWSVSSEVVAGQPFWQTNEIEPAPAVAQAVRRQLLATHAIT